MRLLSVDGERIFEPRVFRVDDLCGQPGRAAGGLVVQQFKIECILRALDEGPEDSYFVWSDADVQPVSSLEDIRSSIELQIRATGMNVYVQREFEDCGVNVGFLVLRRTPATKALFRQLSTRMTQARALDQKVLNAMLLSGEASGVARLPSIFWASSNAAPQTRLCNLVLHHANYIHGTDRGDSRDPKPKLDQLNAVAAFRRDGDEVSWSGLLTRIGASHPPRHGPYQASAQLPTRTLLFTEGDISQRKTSCSGPNFDRRAILLRWGQTPERFAQIYSVEGMQNVMMNRQHYSYIEKPYPSGQHISREALCV